MNEGKQIFKKVFKTMYIENDIDNEKGIKFYLLDVSSMNSIVCYKCVEREKIVQLCILNK